MMFHVEERKEKIMGEAQVRIIHDYTVIDCCNCKMLFAVPEEIDNRWLKTGSTFYCPQGHPQHYTKSENQKLKKQLDLAKKKLERTERELAWAETAKQNLRNTIRAEKGAKTKLKKRIANGVCPCCKRSFANVKRHMDGQHPGYGNKK